MDKNALIAKLEETVRSFKEQLDKHEGSTLAAMATGAKQGFDTARAGFDSLKNSIMGNEKAQQALDSMKEHLAKLEAAVKEGDKKLSAKAVEKLERALRELREKADGKEEDTKGS